MYIKHHVKNIWPFLTNVVQLLCTNIYTQCDLFLSTAMLMLRVDVLTCYLRKKQTWRMSPAVCETGGI